MAVEIVTQEKINREPINTTEGVSPAVSFEKNEISPESTVQTKRTTPEGNREDRRDRAISKAIRDGKKIGSDSQEVKKKVETSHASIDPLQADSWINLFASKRQGESIQDIG